MATGAQLIELPKAADGRKSTRTGKPPRVSGLGEKKLIPFGWYGGKFSHLDWLLPLLPSCHHYCDPTYIHETRGDTRAYGHEMTDAQHRALAAVLNAVTGKVAISNYPCPLMDELYPSGKWWKTVGPARTNHSTKGKRIEALWTNYDPKKQGKGKATTNGSLFQDT